MEEEELSEEMRDDIIHFVGRMLRREEDTLPYGNLRYGFLGQIVGLKVILQ